MSLPRGGGFPSLKGGGPIEGPASPVRWPSFAEFPSLKGGGPSEGWTRKAALAGITWFPSSEGSGLGVTVGDGEHGDGVQQTGVFEHLPITAGFKHGQVFKNYVQQYLAFNNGVKGFLNSRGRIRREDASKLKYLRRRDRLKTTTTQDNK